MTAATLILGACAGGGSEGGGLEIERRTGYAVVVDQSAGGVEIGFSADRDAASGAGFDVSTSLWRLDDGPWNEPPVTCLGRGQRVELGIAEVQNEARPGLLEERVVWIACLSPEEG